MVLPCVSHACLSVKSPRIQKNLSMPSQGRPHSPRNSETQCAAAFPGPVFRSRAPLCHIFLPSVALGIAAKRARTSGAGLPFQKSAGSGQQIPSIGTREDHLRAAGPGGVSSRRQPDLYQEAVGRCRRQGPAGGIGPSPVLMPHHAKAHGGHPAIHVQQLMPLIQRQGLMDNAYLCYRKL